MAFPYSSGDVLTAADLNASSGLQLVTAQDVGSTPVGSVTINNCFSSTFANYRVIYTGGYYTYTSTSQAQIIISMPGMTSSTLNVLLYTISPFTSPNAASTTTNHNILWIGGGDGNGIYADVNIMNVYATDYTYWRTTNYQAYGAAGFGTAWGQHSANVSHTGFSLESTDGGLFRDGTISVYGYNGGY